MPPFDWTKLLEVLKLSPKYWFAIFLATSLVLFLPDPVIGRIGLTGFQQLTRPWLGAAWIFSLVMLFTSGCAWLLPVGAEKITRWRLRRAQIARLRSLTNGEKHILGPFIENQSRTRTFSVNDGTARELARWGFIYGASEISRAFEKFDYNIQPWTWDYLNEHPELVGLRRREE